MKGDVWIAQVAVTPHASSALLPGESLAAKAVKRQRTPELNVFSVPRNQDLSRFYYETEQSFFDGMTAYLRNSLGVKSMITGTAVFGLPLNADLASHQDFVDEHLYPLVEPISGTYSLRLRPDSRFLAYALDARENRVKQVGSGVGTVHLSLDTGADQTVWYEVVADRASTPAISDGAYYLVAKSSGLCVDVQGGTPAIQDGAPISSGLVWAATTRNGTSSRLVRVCIGSYPNQAEKYWM